ncbi:hypothetical protein IFO70_10490 [Phormidium tenue FACHB-886]|nr:hypothetical protein [Phormidium tenue FACHB-886]
MTVNASARRYRIWVCRPSETDVSECLEVTNYCSRDGFLSISDEPVSEDGLLRTTGELVLTPPPGDLVFDTWENESRWAIGNIVKVQVADTNGVMRWHPRSGLRILSYPVPPHPSSPQIQLELGDCLTLLTFREPDDDRSAITFGTGKSRSAIVSTLLAAADINFDGALPGSINYPIPKTETSFVEQAGRVAIAGMSALWQDNQGTVRSKRLNPKPAKRLFKHVVGRDDAGEFEPVQGAERPCSLVKIAGNGYRLEPTFAGDRSITRLYAPASSVDGGTNDNEIQIGTRTTTTQWIGSRFTQLVEEVKARGLLVSDDVYKAIDPNANPGSPFRQIDSLIDEQVSEYEGGTQGRLKTTTQRRYAPAGQIFADLYKRNPTLGNIGGLTRSVQSEQIVTTYNYRTSTGEDTQQQVREIVASTYRPAGTIAGAANDWNKAGAASLVTVLALAERRTQRWTKQGGNWKLTETLEQAGQVRSGTIKAFLALQTTEDTSATSRSGNTQPPSAEVRQPKFERKEVTHEGKAQFKPIAGDTYATRERTLSIDYLTSTTEADRLAQMFGTLQHGRHRGWRIVSALRDEWFNWEPLCRIDLAWNGYNYIGLADLVNWTLAGNEAIVTVECAQMGRTAIARNAADPYPYTDGEPLDPEPAATDLNPEAANLQPIQPIINIVRAIDFTSTTEIEWQTYPFALGETRTDELNFESVTEISIGRSFQVEGISEVSIAKLLQLNVEAVTEVSITLVEEEPVEIARVAYYPFENEAWTEATETDVLIDEEGDSDLFILIYSELRRVAGFTGMAIEGFTTLYSTTEAFSLSNHWRLKIKLYPLFSAGYQIVSLFDAESSYYGWELIRHSDTEIALRLSGDGSEGRYQQIVSPAEFSYNAWHEIEAEANFNTGILRLKVGDEVITAPLTIAAPPALSGVLSVFVFAIRMDEIEFFKE